MAFSSKPQNIYDDPTFFSAYSTLPRSEGGLSNAPEWPVLQNMILQGRSLKPNDTQKPLKGQKVLDLGCGYGWFSRWARDNGATHIRAIDISEKMIDRAKQFEDSAQTTNSSIFYGTGDLDNVTFNGGPEQDSYDFVYSSLTFHYVQDLARLYSEIWASLKPGGRLVFSVEHPICSAPIMPGPDWKCIQEEDHERKIWPLNSYSEEGWRLTSWLGVSGVKKYHRTVQTYVEALLESGFTLKGLKDWVPSKEDVAGHPEWADERHQPYFLLISAEK
ncbi:hypothetical protein PENSTE_c011G00885 [Penicillium steckii]|uniref:Methyltransferase type 11 domain-containing protein n=1 Tax=Penicillium steckii TaxID=303698 RepID=A0A1V6T7L0_9EURO|nr:hypothetical protein PENSTE_c011G00885 [Penicillium steckii]